MATLTRQAAAVRDDPHHFATTAGLVTLVWILAASGVAALHTAVDPWSPSGGAVTRIAVIVVCAWGYMRFCARRAGISHALGVGIAWLTFGIVAEIAVTTRHGHGWYAVLGTPDRPLLRNLFLFVWIFAPAIFAWREDDTSCLRNR